MTINIRMISNIFIIIIIENEINMIETICWALQMRYARVRIVVCFTRSR